MAQRTRKRDPFLDGQMTAVTVVEQSAVELYYDYSLVSEAYRDTLRRSAITIKPRLKRAAEDIFVIGKELKATKALLPHGEYTNWLDIEFGLSERMAQRFVNVYERLGSKSDIMSVLPPTTLYLLAAPSTPDEAIQTVETELDAGERISVSAIQRLIAVAKRNVKSSMSANKVFAGETAKDVPVDDEVIDRQLAAQRMETVLANVVELLSGQSAEDWAILFHSDELSRVRDELVRLKTVLRKISGEPSVAG